MIWLSLPLFIFIGSGTFVFGQSPAKNLPSSHPQLCEIETSPEIFLNKPFEVFADYNFGFEMVWLSNTVPCVPSHPVSITYKFDEEYKTRSEKSVLKRFNKLLRSRPSPNRIRGVYTIVIEPFEKANQMDRRFEYQIRILKIVKIESR